MGPLTSKEKKGFIFSAYYDICGGSLGTVSYTHL